MDCSFFEIFFFFPSLSKMFLKPVEHGFIFGTICFPASTMWQVHQGSVAVGSSQVPHFPLTWRALALEGYFKELSVCLVPLRSGSLYPNSGRLDGVNGVYWTSFHSQKNQKKVPHVCIVTQWNISCPPKDYYCKNSEGPTAINPTP